MQVILIAAMARNRVIGKDGTIPWKIPGEQQRFKQITWGQAVVMGRRTYQSIGRPLPGRRNLVLTRNAAFSAPGCLTFASLDLALSHCRATGEKQVFLIGGQAVYQEGLPLADLVYLSVLDQEVAGDTFFPELPPTFVSHQQERVAGPIPYTLVVYRRRGRRDGEDS